ncbi:MAG: hypothetical protein EKK29_17145 [Hyphomicrobiales bacterium]|nr:MAG: hypothetical protein EKK29_17145 [Hyphomicrobiales bacterium]
MSGRPDTTSMARLPPPPLASREAGLKSGPPPTLPTTSHPAVPSLHESHDGRPAVMLTQHRRP